MPLAQRFPPNSFRFSGLKDGSVQTCQSGEETHNREVAAKQTTLIFSIAKKLKYDITENDIQNEAYYSQGFVNRDNLMLESWEALKRIASAQEEFLKLARAGQQAPVR
jgi:hypothetical protein